jgi:hypothetical protein
VLRSYENAIQVHFTEEEPPGRIDRMQRGDTVCQGMTKLSGLTVHTDSEVVPKLGAFEVASRFLKVLSGDASYRESGRACCQR